MSNRELIEEIQSTVKTAKAMGNFGVHAKLLNKAAAALQAMEWQDISKAPKDGTQVLAVAANYPDDISIVSWQRAEYGNCWIGMCDGAKSIEAQGDCFTDYHTPFVTHFTPLPPAPEEE